MAKAKQIAKEIITFEHTVANACSSLKFGAHVATTGGISNAVTNAFQLGCRSFAMFLKNPRRWDSPALTSEEISKFKKNCKELKYDTRKDVLPHGQYFINLCNPSPDAMTKSYNAFVDDLQRCESLDIGHYNLHPGSVLKGGDRDKGIAQLADCINRAHKQTEFVKVVLENMASDNVIGCKLEDLKEVIDLVEDKDRVGVCVDTCHSFAAGYDLRTEDSCAEFWGNFDKIIGYEYLLAIHLNDSKGPLLSNRDLHQNLGLGFLGLEAFRIIANNERFQGIPIILETPYLTNVGDEHYKHEIELLDWLSGKQKQDIKEKEHELGEKGAKERDEQYKKFEKKVQKRAADLEKASKQDKPKAKRAKKSKSIDAFFSS